MPITPEGDALTEAHRRQQTRIGTMAGMRARRDYTRMVVPGRPATYRNYVNHTVEDILRERERSRRAARRYFERMIDLEAPGSRIPPYRPQETDPDIEERLRRSLYVVGSSRPRKHERLGREDEAIRTGAVGVTGVAIRHTINAGREELVNSVQSTRVAVGMVRVTAMDNNVCWFCAMLASRRDYKDSSFDKSDPRFKLGGNPMANVKVHDHCRCMSRVLFDDEVPERTKYYEKLWYDLSEGDDDLATNFRRNWAAMVSSP